MVLKILFQLLLLIVIVAVLYLFIKNISPTSGLSLNISQYLHNFSFSGLLNATKQITLNYTTPGPPQNFVPQNQVLAYALTVINQNRQSYGLPNVTYSNITSAQQHAGSMLAYHYFSHWDIFGMKPYMRYTLLNGTQGVDENVAYIYNSSGVSVLSAIKQMEYSMMYNDEQCCNNGHRDNILDQQHNQVSIGVAYNRTTIYFDEDFINNYIAWQAGTPSYNNGEVSLQGADLPGYYLASVEISYDAPVMNMTVAQLDNTSSYSYGQEIAGVGHRVGASYYYFSNMQTINATTYVTQNNDFDVSFNINNLIKNYSAGEYTIMVFLTNSTGSNQSYCFTGSDGVQYCNTFLASTYTIFINQSGQRYIPNNV